MCGCNSHSCIKTIETVTSSSVIKMPDSAEIRDGKIRSISLRRLGGASATSITGNVLAADTVISTAHLTLVNAKNVNVMIIPLSLLQRDYNSPEPYKVDPEVYSGIDLSRSTITLSTSAAGYSATAVIELVFEYNCPVC